MKLKPERDAAETARALLPKLARKYFEAGRDALEGKPSPAELHRFRITTKRFRYTVELFRPLYGPKLERYLKTLRALQGTLGKLSDYQSIQAALDGDNVLRTKMQQATKRQLRELRRQWMVFDAAGELKRWKAYLSRDRSSRPSPARTARQRPGRRADAKIN